MCSPLVTNNALSAEALLDESDASRNRTIAEGKEESGNTRQAYQLLLHRLLLIFVPNRKKHEFLFLSFSPIQSSVYNWVQVHRVHHKYAETVKDPLNFRRGFFFAHVGWYCLSFHPACKREMERIDMSDIKADKDIMFQYK